MPKNRVKQIYESGQVAFGTNVAIPSRSSSKWPRKPPHLRSDRQLPRPRDAESLANMVRSCYDQDITPWIRCRNDPWVIMTALDMGAQAISISNIGTVERAQQAVASTFYPPKGEREMARAHRYRSMSGQEYRDFSANDVFLSVQVEGDEGIVNYKEIVKVEGLDCIQTVATTSRRRSASRQEFDPRVIDMEDRIVGAALEAVSRSR